MMQLRGSIFSERICGIWTVFLVYAIGLYYAVTELFFDVQAKRKGFSNKDYLMLLSKCKFYQHSNEKRTAVVTGGSGTIGNEIVGILLQLNYKVVVICQELGSLADSNIESLKTVIINLADLNMVKKGGLTLADELENIDLIICGAAIMLYPYKLSPQGYEYHMAINLLAHALLLECLKPAMNKAENETRVAVLSSCTAHCGNLDSEKIKNGTIFSEYINGYQAYVSSKLAFSLYVEQLHKQWATCYNSPYAVLCSLHPGCVPGGLYRNTNILFRVIINYVLPSCLRDKTTAAYIALRTVMSDNLTGGSYYENMCPTLLRPDISYEIRKLLFFKIRNIISGYML